MRRVVDDAIKDIRSKILAKKQTNGKTRGGAKKKAPSTTQVVSGSPGQQAAVIGVFEATHIADVPVQVAKGDAAVRECIVALKDVAKTEVTGVFVAVSAEGIRVVDALSSVVLDSDVVQSVSFTTVAGKVRAWCYFGCMVVPVAGKVTRLSHTAQGPIHLRDEKRVA